MSAYCARGSKRPYEPSAAAAASGPYASASSSSSSSSRAIGRAKVYDYERDIVPMCQRTDAADLPQLRNWLQQLIMSGKIAPEAGVSRPQMFGATQRWSRARVCQALQQHFVGLAGQPVASADGRRLTASSASAGSALAAATAPGPAQTALWSRAARTDLWSQPNLIGQHLSAGDVRQLAAVSRGTKDGTDKIHAQCQAQTQQGAQCTKRLREGMHAGADACVHYCASHLQQIVRNYLEHLRADGATLSITIRLAEPTPHEGDGVKGILRVEPNVDQWSVSLTWQSTGRLNAWAHSVAADFAQSVGAAPPEEIDFSGIVVEQSFSRGQVGQSAKFVAAVLLQFGTHVVDAFITESSQVGDQSRFDQLTRLRTMLAQTGVTPHGLSLITSRNRVIVLPDHIDVNQVD